MSLREADGTRDGVPAPRCSVVAQPCSSCIFFSALWLMPRRWRSGLFSLARGGPESGLCVEPLSVAPLQPFFASVRVGLVARLWAIPRHIGAAGFHLLCGPRLCRRRHRGAFSAGPRRSRRHVHRSPVTGIPRNDGGGCPLGGESIIVESKSPIPSAAAEPGPSPLSPRPSTRSALSRALCRFASSKCRCLMRSASQSYTCAFGLTMSNLAPGERWES